MPTAGSLSPGMLFGTVCTVQVLPLSEDTVTPWVPLQLLFGT